MSGTGPRRTLRAQLLGDLSFVTSAAVLIVGLATALVSGGDLHGALVPLLLLWLGSTGVFVLFALHAVRRQVLDPLVALGDEADALAEQGPAAPAGRYESAEFQRIAAQYREMAASLLDAQSQVVRAEKLAGIGRLAAGVAHEIRNPLGALGTYTEVLTRRGVEPEITGEMRRAIDRIERTVDSLLTYARPGAPTGTVDLAAAGTAVIEFLRAQGRFTGHPLDVGIEPSLPAVRGDRHALEQVIVNLLLNACDAAPQSRIWLGMIRRSLDPRHRDLRRQTDTTGGPPPGREFTARPRRPEIAAGTVGVLVFVADDGPGVPEADRERIFDPFFTTKDPGQGTGLGLAIVARTVHEAGGMVWVDRAREGGAAFKIFLPAVS